MKHCPLRWARLVPALGASVACAVSSPPGGSPQSTSANTGGAAGGGAATGGGNSGSATGTEVGSTSGAAAMATTGTSASAGSATGATTGSAATGSGTGGTVQVMSAPAKRVMGPAITFTEFALPRPPPNSAPGGICAGPDGRIWFLHQDTGPSALGALNIDGSSMAQYAQGVQQTNIGPIAINPGPDGNVWYTKQQGIGRMQPSGAVTEFRVPRLADTGGIIKGSDGNMWFTEPIAGRIGKITPAGQATDMPLPDTSAGPSDITAGPDGNLWFTETTANKIGRMTPAGMITEYPIPTLASLPRAITAGPDGNIWFTEHDARNIARITPMGAVTEFGIPSGARPYAIAPGPDGNVWFTEPGGFNAVGRCQPDGGISEYPIPTPNTEVSGITAGPDKNLWIAERDADKIGRISNLMGGGNVQSATGNFGTPLTPKTMCTKDTDCINSGQACGGDVCSHQAASPTCVLSISADPGYCTVTADCWCTAEGATCNAATHRCSIVSH